MTTAAEVVEDNATAATAVSSKAPTSVGTSELAEPDALKSTNGVFRYTAEVHVDEVDFHAFIRLPNQFQHADIRTKAMAAKARRMRQLRDPESDAFVVLDADMDEIYRVGDKAIVVEELVGREWWKDHLEAVKDVQEREEYTHIEEDQRRLDELNALPADQRPAEEHAELEKHVLAYGEAVLAEREARQKPRREALEAKDISELVDMLREDRITAEGNAVFNLTFSKWEWLSGTYHLQDGKPGERYFASIEEVENADPRILEALANAYSDLETSFQRGLAGNS